jgi:hypothetical protein
MYCQSCGKELPTGSATCPFCGFAAPAPGRRAGSSSSLDDVLFETKRAAQDLASSAAKLSERLLTKAGYAAKDPKGSAKKAVKRVAEELEGAAREIDRIVRDL